MTTARQAYANYIKTTQSRFTSSAAQLRKIELIKILAERRPSAEPNLQHRVAVAKRHMKIYGIPQV